MSAAPIDILPDGEFFVVSDYGAGDGACSEAMTADEALIEYTQRKFRTTPEKRSVGGLGWSGLIYTKAAQFADARRRGIHYISAIDRSADFGPLW